MVIQMKKPRNIPKQITITPAQQEFLERKFINLSKLVRSHIWMLMEEERKKERREDTYEFD